MRVGAALSLAVLRASGLRNHEAEDEAQDEALVSSVVSCDGTRLGQEDAVPVAAAAGLAIALGGAAAAFATGGGPASSCEVNVLTINPCGAEQPLQNRRDFLRTLVDTYVVSAAGDLTQPWDRALTKGYEYSDALYRSVAEVVDGLAPGRILAAELSQVLGMNTKLDLFRGLLLPRTFTESVPPPGGLFRAYLYPEASPGEPVLALHAVFTKVELERFYGLFRVPFESPGSEHLRARFELAGGAAGCSADVRLHLPAHGSSTWDTFSQWTSCAAPAGGPCTQGQCTCLDPEDRSWTRDADQRIWTTADAVSLFEEVAGRAPARPMPGQAFQCASGTLGIDETSRILLPGPQADSLFATDFTPLERAELVQAVAAQLAGRLLGRALPRGCRSVLNREAGRDPAQFCWIKSVRLVRDADAIYANRGAVGFSLLFGTGLAPDANSIKVRWWQVRETDQARAFAAQGKSLWAYSVVAPNLWWRSVWAPFRGKKRVITGAGEKRARTGEIVKADGAF